MREIASIKTHIRWIERGMIAFGVCLAGLAGFAWHGYDGLTSKLNEVAIEQKATNGKIETLEARLSGRLDVIAERLSDEFHAGSETNKAPPQ